VLANHNDVKKHENNTTQGDLKMSNENTPDMVVDVDWAGTKEERSSGGIFPEIGEQEFEVTKVFSGMQKKGDNTGHPYFNLKCVQMSGEFPGTRSAMQFLGLGQAVDSRGISQRGAMKAFIVDVGRSDLLQNSGIAASDFMGIQFTATVAHGTNKKTGEPACYLNNPKPLVYDDAPAETPAAQAAPAQPLQPAAAAALVTLAQNAPAPAVEPQPAAPRRMRPTARG
jgi:hypothetical protein